jgi:C1A family cysteine protease
MARSDEKNRVNREHGKEYAFGVTKFSDRTQEELSVPLGRKGKGKKPARIVVKEAESLSSTTYVDWVAEGMVTPVKNQGQCGSCWAFSTAEAVESAWAMAGNMLWEFSPQQVASCTPDCFGCGGGDTVTAYEYLNSTIGLGAASAAPYVQSMYTECLSPVCTQSCDVIPVDEYVAESALIGPYATVAGYEFGTTPCYDECDDQDMTLLASNVAQSGPASVCVNAGEWSDYTGGVMSAAACGGYAYDDLDHCVQLVGFNTNASTPYWIVRNSWATNWGEDGYVYLEYPANACGLGNEATFVTLGSESLNTPSKTRR